MKLLRTSLWTVLLAGVTLAAVVPLVALQSRPLVLEVDQLSTERAAQAHDLASRIVAEVTRSDAPGSLVLRKNELNGLMALAARAFPRLAGRVNANQYTVLAALTIRLPDNPFGSYLNLALAINESESGLDIDQAMIGPVTLPGSIAEPLGRLLLNLALGNGNGSFLLDIVQGVTIADDEIQVTFHSVPDFQDRLAGIRDRLKLARDEAAVLGDPALIRIYYDQIVDLAELADPRQPISLAAYMTPVFQVAQSRSRVHSPMEENRAAILALAIYFGSSRFETLTGPVHSPAQVPHESRAGPVTLAQRQDLRLHFIYSAALELASDAGASFAIGEFKEMLDTSADGSGYSFADLAADRAGVWFAEAATRDDVSARRLQGLVAGSSSEAVFFPSVDDLPEGLSQQAFEAEYGSVDGPRHQSMVAEIDRRLLALPLFLTEP